MSIELAFLVVLNCIELFFIIYTEKKKKKERENFSQLLKALYEKSRHFPF